MSMKAKRGMLPSDVILPITPMLDMSFQLLFFFICIYQPPTTQENQFILDLRARKVGRPPAEVASGTGGSPSPSSPSSNNDPIAYDITLDVYTHINPGAGGAADHLIDKVKITGIIPAAKKKMRELGLIKD